jgi:hypothetical protein
MRIHSKSTPFAFTFLLAALLAACGGGNASQGDPMEEPDLMMMRKPSTLTIEWSEKVMLGRYDFSKITFIAKDPDVWLSFGGTEQGGWYVEARAYDKTIEPNLPIFWTRYGWSAEFFHEWFGKHAANFAEVTIKGRNDFCYALESSLDQFTHTNGRDQDGLYTDLSTGPINIQQSSSACGGTPSFSSAGTLTMTLRYRCSGNEHGRARFPDWACR